MLARVFQCGVQHIEHSGNPLGDLSMPRGFDRTLQKQKSSIVAFFILFDQVSAVKFGGLLHFTQVSFGGFLPSPWLGRASFHLSVINIELKRLLKGLRGEPHSQSLSKKKSEFVESLSNTISSKQSKFKQ